MNSTIPRMMTLEQVAEALTVSESTARRLIHTGEIPFQRIGKKLIRVKEIDFLKYISRH